MLVALLAVCAFAADQAPPPPPPFGDLPADSPKPPAQPPSEADTPAAKDASEKPDQDQKPVTPAVDVQGVAPGIQPPPPLMGTAGPQAPLKTFGEEEAAKTPKAKKRKGGVLGLFQKAGLFQGISITGQDTLTFQKNNVQGSRATYESQRWDTASVLNQSSLHLEGPVWRELVFQADISDSGWGQSYSNWVAGYVGHDTALLYGDLNVRLGGNEFVSFSKSTQGYQLDQKLPRNGFMRSFYIREKGLVRNQTFVGNGTTGPYFLTYTPIIEGSEVVKVNEEFLSFGDDYRLDYDTGQLWFEPLDGQARIITAADTVSVSYQSLGYLDQGPGQLYGLRAEMPMLDDKLLVGLTTIQQDRRTAGSVQDTVGYQEDIYNGSGTTGPFDTNFRPIIPDGTSAVYKGDRQIIDNALVVLVDSVQQLEGVDYDAYRSIGRVIFRRAVPPTALVIIRYFYDIDSSSSTQTGDKSLWGVDLNYDVGKGINLTLDWARSDGETEEQKGDALSTSVDYTRDGLHLLGEFRSIDPTYSYIDTVGFQNREKGFNLGGEWRLNDNITISDRFSKLDRDSGLSFGYSGYGGGYNFVSSSAAGAGPAQYSSSSSLGVSTTQHDISAQLNYDNLPTVDLRRSTMSNEGGTTSSSDYTTDSIRLNYSPSRKYSAQASLSHTKQRSSNLSSSTGTETPTVSGSDSDQVSTSLNYNPSDKLSFTVSYALNESAAIETVNESSSSSLQLSARWQPTTKVNVNYSRSMSDSNGRVSSGLYSGLNTSTAAGVGLSQTGGFNPGGGGGDDGDGGGTTERPSTDDVTDRLSVSWRPADRLSFDLSYSKRTYDSTGSTGYLADSNQDTWSMGTMWQATDALSLNLSVGYDNMQFLEEGQGAVKNRSYVLSAGYRPPGQKWSAGLTLNKQTGSSPTYVGYGRLQRYKMVDTDLMDISGQFSYMFNDKITLNASAGLSDYAGGYSDFTKNTGEMGLRYAINRNTGLEMGYQYIRHISRTDDDGLIYGTSGSGENYITDNVLLRLTTSFQGGIGAGKGTRGLGSGYGMSSGFSGGPGTFGGYSPGLQTSRYGSSYGSGYGSGMGMGMGMGAGMGMGMGMGTGMGASRSTGFGTTSIYGTSKFDNIGAAKYQTQQSTGIFGPGSSWGSGSTQPFPTTSGTGGITSGLGGFREDDRGTRPSVQDFGKTGPGKATGGTGLAEDWWILEDNMMNW